MSAASTESHQEPGVHALANLMAERGVSGDADLRQSLARLHSLTQISSWHAHRAKAGSAATGGEGNLAKLRGSEVARLTRDIASRLLGADAILTTPADALVTELREQIVFSPAPSIYGGTDEVQRNIIGERVLGLPKEPGSLSSLPFRELPQNR